MKKLILLACAATVVMAVACTSKASSWEYVMVERTDSGYYQLPERALIDTVEISMLNAMGAEGWEYVGGSAMNVEIKQFTAANAYQPGFIKSPMVPKDMTVKFDNVHGFQYIFKRPK